MKTQDLSTKIITKKPKNVHNCESWASKIKVNHKVKIGGQECPLYTRMDPTNDDRNPLT